MDGFGGGSSTVSGSGRHASLLAGGRGGHHNDLHSGTLQLRETNLTGQKINYLDSGYSEEGANSDPLSSNGEQQVC